MVTNTTDDMMTTCNKHTICNILQH